MSGADLHPGTLCDHIASVAARFPAVAVAYLFGSRARGDAREDSDVDVGLVLQERGATALDHYWTLADLASRLESRLGGPGVDVVLLEPQGPVFCHQVLREGRLAYCADDDRRVDFESETYVRYFDFRPTYEIAARERLAGLRRWARKPRTNG